MDDPFDDPKLLLERAEENIRELQTRAKAFFDGKPYISVIEVDPDTLENIHKLKFTEKLPKALNAVAADALNNLRAALDQAVCTSSTLLKPGVDLKGMGFPFASSESKMAGAIASKCKNVPPEVVAFVSALKPYKGGNNLLWALSDLSATNRHRRLIDSAATTDGMFIHHMAPPAGTSIPVAVWDGAKHELAFARTPHGSKLQYDVEFSFFIAFQDVEIVGGQPTIPVLGRMGNAVTGVLNALRFEILTLLKSRT